MTKIWTYNKRADDLRFETRSGHDYKSYRRGTNAAERFEHSFLRPDFKNASVLDIGCNKGYMMEQAQLAGARSTNGIEISPEAAKEASQFGDTICGSVEDMWLWRELAGEKFDVVMLLAVWKTSPFALREAIVAHAIQKTGKVLYFETHRNESYIHVAWTVMMMSEFTRCQRISYDPETTRYMLRFSFEEPSKDATMIPCELEEFKELGVCQRNQTTG